MKGNWGSRSRLPPHQLCSWRPSGENNPCPGRAEAGLTAQRAIWISQGLQAWSGQEFLVLFD